VFSRHWNMLLVRTSLKLLTFNFETEEIHTDARRSLGFRTINLVFDNTRNRGQAVPDLLLKAYAYKGSRGIAPLIFNLGNRWRGMGNFLLRPLYLRKRTPGTH